MQAIHRFSENYVEPLTHHKAIRFIFQVAAEVVKIIAAKIFLEYLGSCYLNDPKKVSKYDVHAATVSAPLYEELFFRFGVLKGIHCIQYALHKSGIQVASTLYGPSNEEEEEDKYPITIYPPLVDEMLCRGYIASLYLMSALATAIFNRVHVSSTVYSNEAIEPDEFAFQFTLPFEQDVIYHTLKNGIGLIEIPEEEEVTEEEKVQQVFRIHLAALIFAAAHLSNPHSNKTNAIVQFSWTFLGGIIYGYLSEKYHSLAPGIIAHGMNNSIVVAGQIYSQEVAPFLLVALLANRVVSYLLAVTQIDKVIILGAGQAANTYSSFPERLVDCYLN